MVENDPDSGVILQDYISLIEILVKGKALLIIC